MTNNGHNHICLASNTKGCWNVKFVHDGTQTCAHAHTHSCLQTLANGMKWKQTTHTHTAKQAYYLLPFCIMYMHHFICVELYSVFADTCVRYFMFFFYFFYCQMLVFDHKINIFVDWILSFNIYSFTELYLLRWIWLEQSNKNRSKAFPSTNRILRFQWVSQKPNECAHSKSNASMSNWNDSSRRVSTNIAI